MLSTLIGGYVQMSVVCEVNELRMQKKSLQSSVRALQRKYEEPILIAWNLNILYIYIYIYTYTHRALIYLVLFVTAVRFCC